MGGSAHVDLTGRRALVTGGARGLGASITRRLARAGAAVRVVDVRREEGEKFCARLSEEEGTDVRFLGLDVRDSDAVAAAFRSLDEARGRWTSWSTTPPWTSPNRSSTCPPRRSPG